ncbi:glutamyl-tRNA amidotransferase subunit B [Aulographum hederae CBS 113979]|uniref:Glutamyl-tRNA(Gln) amidotransferase subunit B, mitochondrial n=1 Tax=Aulographum hederae CBS 113979 TaxID=1176131 RepID=A0A6G1GUC4_9PEZI|nr:glutamyl-tRNA amidotransferase subunit B [Aulographum hederae CBS 113979]
MLNFVPGLQIPKSFYMAARPIGGPIAGAWQTKRLFVCHIFRSLQTSHTTGEIVVPFGKQLKDEAKKKRQYGESKSSRKASKGADPRLEKWELTVGIEIHAELNTARKLFSSAATSINAAPNSHVSLVDVAFPGSQPEFQKETLIPALRAAIALNCDIQRKSSFDRKHYFYQDQPAGYQITQFYEPFAKDGSITLYDHDGIAPEDGQSITIGIKQIQMEQDTAKTVQQPPTTHLLDFNRVSHPLIEVITLPHIHHPSTAAACVRKIQSILRSMNAVTAGMEEGGLRADVNVSVRERHKELPEDAAKSYYGVTGLGQRTEIKNLSSFKAVEDAIIAERDRQIDVLENGGVIEGETRGWTLGSTETKRLRGKEGEIDYRYMPDPDLNVVVIGQELESYLRETLPKSPSQLADVLCDSDGYGLTMFDAKKLVALDREDRLDYYMDVVHLLRQSLSDKEQAISKVGKIAANWVLNDLDSLLTTVEGSWSASAITAQTLCDIIVPLTRREITRATANSLIDKILAGDAREVHQIISEENLALVPLSDGDYLRMATDLVEANPDIVKAIQVKRQKGKIGWFVGQMMKTGEEGRIEAARAERALKNVLEVE